VLLVLFGITAVVAAVVLAEVMATVFFAITVAYVLYPVRRWLVNHGRSRRVSAAVASLAGLVAAVVAIVPIFGALYVRRSSFLEFIRSLPAQVPVEAFGFEYVVDVSDAFVTIQRGVTQLAVELASAAPVLALKATLFVLLVYALLLRPRDIRRAVLALVPAVYHDVVLAFHERTRATLNALYVLQAATAFATFCIAYPVFAVLGYESSLVLAVLAGILQFIPVVGPSAVVVALAAYQVVAGDTAGAILVLTLGLVLVGFLPDALIRPRLASLTAGMPGSLYFVGFTGGVLTVGLVGFIAGPLVIAYLLEAGAILNTETGGTPSGE
jgi:predicted PurR-regulated permease PerM